MELQDSVTASIRMSTMEVTPPRVLTADEAAGPPQA